MNEPLVCALMLTRNRQEMAYRAMEAFLDQTYSNLRLIVWNTGGPFSSHQIPCKGKNHDLIWIPDVDASACASITIGELRNCISKYASHSYAASWDRPEIFTHWDDDDISHPNRIAEQVALLQSSGADIVGYNQVLFWRKKFLGFEQLDVTMSGLFGGAPSTMKEYIQGPEITLDEAWLYTHKRNPIGSSLMYWRKTWEDRPFEALPTNSQSTGEETPFLRDRKVVAVKSIPSTPEYFEKPRLICRIHGSNTAHYDIEDQIKRGSTEWSRVPGWDEYCRKVMG